MRGYFGIGIQNCKTKVNLGTLWRSAHSLGASFIFVIGKRYEKQASDTTKAWRSVPLYQYTTFQEFYANVPKDCQLIGIEITEKARKLEQFHHPNNCIYLLGAEDSGLSNEALDKCKDIVVLPGKYCLNVAVAGSVVMYDRIKQMTKE